jgi:hypothetical protein
MLMRAICFVLLSSSLFAGSALAQSGDASAAFYAGADTVFVGRLEKLTPSPNGLTASFSVTQLIKGSAAPNQNTQAQMPRESRCHAFVQDHRYLVYGRKVGDLLWVDPCDGSKLVSQAEADLRYIHTVNPRISEQCNGIRLRRLARSAPIVATARVVGTEDSIPTSSPTMFRPWCGLVFTTEYVYYDVLDVIKGQIPDSKIAVEHAICWDTITVDGYHPSLSPELFREGNVLLLFLERRSHRADQVPPPFKPGYEDIDENCGATNADSDTARSVAEHLRSGR